MGVLHNLQQRVARLYSRRDCKVTVMYIMQELDVCVSHMHAVRPFSVRH